MSSAAYLTISLKALDGRHRNNAGIILELPSAKFVLLFIWLSWEQMFSMYELLYCDWLEYHAMCQGLYVSVMQHVPLSC